MKTIQHSILLCLTSLVFVSCGTVSTTKPGASGTSSASVSKTYSKVLVKDFTAGPDSGADAASCLKFTGVVAGEIVKSSPNTQVLRTGTADASTLVIGGEITRFVEGNAALRLLVGMGAGSSYFDATIRATDGASGASVATLSADKNSWGLGGSLAAGQTVYTFMDEAAKKTAKEVAPYLK